MSLKVEDDNVLIKHNEIWAKLKKMLSIKLHSQPVYDKEYVKNKVKTFNEVVNRRHSLYLFNSNIDFIMKVNKKNYPQVNLEQCKHKIKKKKVVNFIDVELDLHSNDSNYPDSE